MEKKIAYIIAWSVVGVFFFAFLLTVILTSAIVTSSLKDTWIKPGEQVLVCNSKEFTVKPAKAGVMGFISTIGAPQLSTDKRVTNEVFEGTVKSGNKFDLTKFQGKGGDIVHIDLESTGFNALEVYYYKRVKVYKYNSGTVIVEDSINKDGKNKTFITARRGGHSSGGSSSSGRKKSGSSANYENVRFVAFYVNGTGSISGEGSLPGVFEYGISLSGNAGAEYEINITYSRNYYYSATTTNFTAGEKKKFNSEKYKEFCIALDMEYDGPITEPDASRNDIDLYCAQRYTNGDTKAMLVLGLFFVVSIIVVSCITLCIRNKDKYQGPLRDVRSNNRNDGNGGMPGDSGNAGIEMSQP